MRGCIADGILLNPTLNSDCSGLYAGWWFCVGIPTTSAAEFGWTTTDAPANVPTFTGNYTFTTLPEVNSTFKAEPTQTGIVGGCLSYYQAQDGETYRNIVDGHYLTQEDFMAMNPALNGNCDGLWLGYYYCVVGPSGITAMPPTATSPPHRRRLRSRLAKPASVVIGTSAMASRAPILSPCLASFPCPISGHGIPVSGASLAKASMMMFGTAWEFPSRPPRGRNLCRRLRASR